MTVADKAAFLEQLKKAMVKEQGVAWEYIEPGILAEIDRTFDDDMFAKMDPDSRIDAAYARKEFADRKPAMVDYLLWSISFATRSDYVEW